MLHVVLGNEHPHQGLAYNFFSTAPLPCKRFERPTRDAQHESLALIPSVPNRPATLANLHGTCAWLPGHKLSKWSDRALASTCSEPPRGAASSPGPTACALQHHELSKPWAIDLALPGPGVAPLRGESTVMSATLQHFLRRYVAAVRGGDAALFIGAGLSMPVGFLDWKGLLQECADELQLDLRREHDLVAVAQYYLNAKGGERGDLTSILRTEFDRLSVPSENHEIIARLPIRTVWTTNYDTVIERAYDAAHRSVDVKRRDQDIPVVRQKSDARLYKMHGDVSEPFEMVICKEDYERYPVKHQLFQSALEVDLLSKTFLFLGFGFTDPNLDYILDHVRTLLDHDKREHYTIMRQARLSWHFPKSEAEAQLEYEQRRQSLRIRDLQRYGIEAILVQSFAEVTRVLRMIEQVYKRHCVFISGSAHQFGSFTEERLRDLCMQLGERLMRKDYQLITGLGLNVGDTVLKGALVELYRAGKSPSEERLTLRPFPRQLPVNVSEQEFNRQYRSDMITRCGAAIFIAGTSRTSPVSRGVMQEFRLACELGKTVIPVGVTGFAAREIWMTMRPGIQHAYGGAVSDELFGRLNDDSLDNDRIVDAIFEMMHRVGHDERSARA
jgi:hypothetical protein